MGEIRKGEEWKSARGGKGPGRGLAARTRRRVGGGGRGPGRGLMPEPVRGVGGSGRGPCSLEAEVLLWKTSKEEPFLGLEWPEAHSYY